MSIAAAESIASSSAAGDGARRAGWVVGPSGRHVYAVMAGVALLIALLSLLIPSTPSYDPWAWLVWGREIIHVSLHAPGGPTWKPLPVIFTTVFALFGSIQPFLWLIVARTGAIMAAFVTCKLAARLTRWLRNPADDDMAEGALLERVAPLAPAMLAGLIAMIGLTFSGNLLSDSALGYSEGLTAAAVLIAVERHLDGHPHQAFFFGFVAALDRPETWLFWASYGLWLMKNPSSRKLVVGLAALTLFLWFVPQKWGGGSLTSGISRAQHPRSNSAAFASCPFCTELHHASWLVLLPIKVSALLVIGAASTLLVRLWRSRGGGVLPSWAFGSVGERALALLVLSGSCGYAWWILIALETQAGFSGNDRYLVLGSALIEVCGAVGFGWAALAAASWLRRSGPALTSASRQALGVTGATAVSGLVFLFVPNWVGAHLIDIPRTDQSLIYLADQRQDLETLIRTHGGAKGVNACGQVMTEAFKVPMVAWYLGLRTIQVEDEPNVYPDGRSISTPPPNVIFQTRDTREAPLLPLPATIRDWKHNEDVHYIYERDRTFRFFEACPT
ncbi:MAG: hypothetical protein ACLP8S_27540 [Solirubrobacteraceae bacterium]